MESKERTFEAYGEPLENMTERKYLGRVMTAGYDDWPVVVGNFQRARKSWGRLLRILNREGEDPKVSGIFLISDAGSVVVRVETWVLNPRMERVLGSFQNRVVKRLTGRHMRIRGGGIWEYSPLE